MPDDRVDQHVAGPRVEAENLFLAPARRQPGQVGDAADVLDDATSPRMPEEHVIGPGHERCALPADRHVRLTELRDDRGAQASGDDRGVAELQRARRRVTELQGAGRWVAVVRHRTRRGGATPRARRQMTDGLPVRADQVRAGDPQRRAHRFARGGKLVPDSRDETADFLRGTCRGGHHRQQTPPKSGRVGAMQSAQHANAHLQTAARDLARGRVDAVGARAAVEAQDDSSSACRSSGNRGDSFGSRRAALSPVGCRRERRFVQRGLVPSGRVGVLFQSRPVLATAQPIRGCVLPARDVRRGLRLQRRTLLRRETSDWLGTRSERTVLHHADP